MATGGVNIVRTNGGLGRENASEDSICGLLMSGLAVSGKLALGTTYVVKSVDEAEALGLDAAYDDDNSVLVRYHIGEFFRMSPGATLYIMLVAQSVTLTQMCNKANAYAKKLLTDAGGKIRQIGVARNPLTSYSATLADGLDADVKTAIPKLQELLEEEAGFGRYASGILEGRSFNGSVGSAYDLRNISGVAANYVSLVIAQDYDVAELKAIYNGHASVGTILGCASFASVHESIGWVEKFPLTNVTNDKYVSAALSSHSKIESYEASLDDLDDKGYIFATYYPGTVGYFFNDDYTCTTNDDDFCKLRHNRTFNKAARLLIKKMTPDINAPQQVNPDNGQLHPVVIKSFEEEGHNAIAPMQNAGEISGKKVVVSPTQNVLTTEEVVVELSIVPFGNSKFITNKVGFKTSIA